MAWRAGAQGVTLTLNARRACARQAPEPSLPGLYTVNLFWTCMWLHAAGLYALGVVTQQPCPCLP